ncbi:F-box/LRR-repeat protein, putative [Entamoeba invadens IP1]|uniref:F-box/LRR-repeat protein, putative n=1 Tax=Entamoeba invadens IP1 TaxID=370355 RepID=A0A0A1UG30_ENTIV|nr:F-box/LRR-repeat protein, putative [Entamoeba invadens IP1]ELP92184.1 F-box/LRR-repeat protein, putative [Entamoeba invadens IP1]|eukprot:XP_004258955.1 F-box/LRR-repeat protein, putative [Entamoeba invadens IP1]
MKTLLAPQRRRKAVSLNIPSHPFALLAKEGVIIPSLTEIILDAFGRFEENFTALSASQLPHPLPPLLASRLLQVVANNPTASDMDLNIIMYRLLAAGTGQTALDIHGTHLLTRPTCLNIFQLSMTLNITTLDISQARGCTSDDLSLLCKNLKNLKYLNTSGCLAFDDYCLASVLQLRPPLETINISSCPRITDYSLQCIANIQTLRIFKANNTALTFVGLKFLNGLFELELLNCKYLTDQCLDFLSRSNPQLRSLAISGPKITDKAIQVFLQRTPNLNFLNLTNCVNAGVFTLSQLFHSRFKLISLNLSNCFSVSADDLMRAYNQLYASTLFSWLVDLRYLNLCGCTRITPAFLSTLLQNTPKLKTLILDAVTMDETSMQMFLQSSTVAADVTRRSVARSGAKISPLTISFSHCNISTQCFVNLFSVRGCDLISLNVNCCPTLNELAMSVLGDCAHSLTHFYCQNNSGLTETALIQFIYRSPRLRVLFLNGTSAVTNRVILAVRDSCLNISHFNISECENITPESAVVLSSMRSLQYLDISFTKFTPETIKPVVNSLPRITYFSMQGVTYKQSDLFLQEAQWMNVMRLNFSQCSDALLENISNNCPLLTTLELRMCSLVTDSGIKTLIQKCTKLITVVLLGTSVSPQILGFLSSRGVAVQ